MLNLTQIRYKYKEMERVMRKPLLVTGLMMMFSGAAMGASLDISMSVDGRCRNPSMDVFIDGDKVATKSSPSITRSVSRGVHEVRVKAFCGKVGNRKHIGTKTDTIGLKKKKHKSMHFSFNR